MAIDSWTEKLILMKKRRERKEERESLQIIIRVSFDLTLCPHWLRIQGR